MALQSSDLFQVWDGTSSSYRYVTWNQIISKTLSNTADVFLVTERLVGDSWQQYKISLDDLYNLNGVRKGDLYMVQRGDDLYKVTLDIPPVAQIGIYSPKEFIMEVRPAHDDESVVVRDPDGKEWIFEKGGRVGNTFRGAPEGIWTITGRLGYLSFIGRNYWEGYGGTIDFSASSADAWNIMTEDSTEFGKNLAVQHDLVIVPPGFKLKSGYAAFSTSVFNDANALADLDVSGVSDMTSMLTSVTCTAGSFNLANWDVSSVTNAYGMFANAKLGKVDTTNWVFRPKKVNNIFCNCDMEIDANSWDLSQVTELQHIFSGSYHSDKIKIDKWDVSNVRNFKCCFQQADINQDLSGWDVSSGTDFTSMFAWARSFNYSLNDWDVSKATKMEQMFNSATNMGSDISLWCTPKINSEPVRFADGTKMQPEQLPPWTYCKGKVIQELTIADADTGNTVLAGPLATFYVSKTAKYDPPAQEADKFTWYKNKYEAGTPEADSLELKDWELYKEDATSITTTQSDVNHAFVVKQENGPAFVYSNEMVPALTFPSGPHVYFGVANGTARLGVYLADYLHTNTNTKQSFYKFENGAWILKESIPDTRSTGDSYIELDEGLWATPAVANFEGWYTAWDPRWRCDRGVDFKIAEFSHMEHINNCASLFAELDTFNQDLSWWVCKPRVANRMFKSCHKFNQPVDHFDMSECIGLWRIFEECYEFNQPVNSWDVAKVTNAKYAFNHCRKFNQSLAGMNWATCYELMGLMYKCPEFNSPIGNITILPGQSAEDMFQGCTKFNQPILGLDVSGATNLRYMFFGCKDFDQSLENFNPASATTMQGTFADTSINQDVSHFDTSQVVMMRDVFSGSAPFNQDISNWDMTNVEDVSYIFNNCTSYYQDLSSVDWTSVTLTAGWNNNTRLKTQPSWWPRGV